MSVQNGELLKKQLQDEIYLLQQIEDYKEYVKLQTTLNVGKRIEELLLKKQHQIKAIDERQNVVENNSQKVKGAIQEKTPEEKRVEETSKEIDKKSEKSSQDVLDELELPDIGLDEEKQD